MSQRVAHYWFCRVVLRRVHRSRRPSLSRSFDAFWWGFISPCQSFAYYLTHPRVYFQARALRSLWKQGRDSVEA